uniref:Uncharacterized protein n=1 Tax=Alexandrium catenella TaxID=2925 RepID=A0A7S1WFY4_ALECA|mmetsp:Transcript_57524/g.154092  ORF Transcript_57524/g.154092 Transcript_57524/m.154092 type:complete len:137 (+) Transcript_57524:1-411(+)
MTLAARMAGSPSGALRAWLAGILLNVLVESTPEVLQNFDVVDCEQLLTALGLCSVVPPEAGLWAPAYRPLVTLVERVARCSGCLQALARGLALLARVFPERGWETAAPLATRITSGDNALADVRQEVLDFFARTAA